MGNLKNNTAAVNSRPNVKGLTKGQRLGWAHKSDKAALTYHSIKASNGVTLQTYQSGPYAINKLVP